ncbi:MAG: dihydroorotase [Bdellovibrionales bacterium]|nr:dihydroorotase [Bdellovibrionales bacterium]
MFKVESVRLLDPSQNLDQIVDVLVNEGVIVEIQDPGSKAPAGSKVIEGQGLCMSPGFVDMHVHFRDPGQLHKEDLETGSQAAVAGGYTSVMCMPNTLPAIDSVDTVAYILDKAKKIDLCKVYPVGAVSKSLMGKDLSPIEDLARAGCVAFSDDGKPVEDTALLRKALLRTKALNMPLIEHCEENDLSRALVTIHEGEVASKLGLKGISTSAETVDVARLIALSFETGAKVHLAHLSCGQSIEFLQSIRGMKHQITSEVTPHHLLLTDQVIEDIGTLGKMYPPLRTQWDCDQMVLGLREGLIDAVATDHAPHTEKEKSVEFSKAPNGVIGLETALTVLLDLVSSKKIELLSLIRSMSTRPAEILGLRAGSLAKGMPADFVLFSLDEEVSFARTRFASRSQNTPFRNFVGKGKIKATFVGGREVYSNWN